MSADGHSGWLIDRSFEARADWVEWCGVRIRNWHRLLADYMAAVLRHVEEPRPAEETDAKSTRYRGIPMFVSMKWQKPRRRHRVSEGKSPLAFEGQLA